MRFRSVHKVATYLMVLSSLGALAFGGNVSLPILLLVGLAAVISAFVPERRSASLLWQTAWTVSTFIALGLCVVEFLLRNELVLSTVNFLLFLLINKLFNRRSGRDYLQLYVVTFMMVVAGSVLNIGLSFALWFVVYIVATTWSLILFHLRREMEENYLIKHSTDSQSERVAVDRILNSRRIVGGRFLLGTSVVSITVFVLAIATFLFFPRVGSNMAFGNRGPAQHLTGFSDKLSLGGHGRLRDNPQIVMRVYLKNRPRGLSIARLHWRGTAFDRYAEGRWFRTTNAPVPSHTKRRGLLEIHHKAYERASTYQLTQRVNRALRQEVFLEPVGTDLVFAASQPIAVDLRRYKGTKRPDFRVGAGGELRGNFGAAGGQYVVYSDLTRPSRTQLRRTPNTLLDPSVTAHYLRPQDRLPTGVVKRANQITAGKSHRLDKVDAVLRYLGRGFRYSRLLRSPKTGDPLVYFLERTKAGHCEYFASAMVLLLRASGVPARVVTGFLGGAWNDYGDYVLVRQGDAHAWVEVWFEGVGWITYDPTPPAGRRPVQPSGFFDRMKLFFDSLRMRWHRWVVDYDVTRQVGVLQRVKVGLKSFKRRTKQTFSGSRTWGWIALGVAVVLLGLFWLLRRRAREEDPLERLATKTNSRLARPVARLLKGLAKHGFHREPGQTLRELAQQVDKARPTLSPSTTGVTLQYYELRYSGQATAPKALTELDRSVAALLTALAHRGSDS